MSPAVHSRLGPAGATFVPVLALDVIFHGHSGPRRLGTLGFRQRRAWFEFDARWLEDPLPVSPVALPARAGLHEAPPAPFEGLHGLFHDSLPEEHLFSNGRCWTLAPHPVL